MAEAVQAAIDGERHCIAEAGTGTGKTFAYLVPAILSGKKILVSTGTKNLQDQLFNKDLPLIRKALSVPFRAALLKGRGNYLCLYRLHNAIRTDLGFSAENTEALHNISRWAQRTRSGDIAEMAEIEEAAPVWLQATSNVDNCLGQECPDYDACFLVKARDKAREADVLVVNHHLLCADWSIREIGFGELLPEADVVIIDEAHQLAETASNFLGVSLGARQLNELAKDSLTECLKDAADMADLRAACEALEYAVKDTRLDMGAEMRKGDWRELEGNIKAMASLQVLAEKLHALCRQLELASVRGKGLESCFKRAQDMAMRLQSIRDEDSGNWIRWYETHRVSFTLNRTPLDIAGEFQGFMRQHGAVWIFTSATLSVAGDFAHFAYGLGVHGAISHSWDSPFDFSRQALFYHPRNLPQPDAADFVERIVEIAVPVLEASRGRAFFLFTSHHALKKAAALLEARIAYPLLVQGSRPKGVLLDDFKRHGNAVLLGTSSFWEGVDVKGEALSCVIIDKLPFAAPGDPVLKARLDAMRTQGRNPFMDYQIPAAVIALKQGVGRLIRDVHDRGVFLLCDPRLLKRSYGRLFLDSVPPMRRTRTIEDVQAFFVEEKQG
ncbi:MAG: ATP-dependent DNA helicase [Gammaproteobacteria bacterium]